MDKEKKLAKVLELVNTGRVAMGYKPIKKLPKGVRGDGHSCPLQKALKVYSVGSLVDVCDGWDESPKCEAKAKALGKAWHKRFAGVEVYLPNPLVTFVDEFDSRLYPELEL